MLDKLSHIGFTAVLISWISACVLGERAEDALEPNNDLSTATRLFLGQSLQARVQQGNRDVFCTDSGPVVFIVQHRGLERCPRFTVLGPDKVVLYQEPRDGCGLMGRLVVDSDQVSYQHEGLNYHFRIRGKTGRYCLIIDQQGLSDNLLPFAWDYTIRITKAP